MPVVSAAAALTSLLLWLLRVSQLTGNLFASAHSRSYSLVLAVCPIILVCTFNWETNNLRHESIKYSLALSRCNEQQATSNCSANDEARKLRAKANPDPTGPKLPLWLARRRHGVWGGRLMKGGGCCDRRRRCSRPGRAFGRVAASSSLASFNTRGPFRSFKH